MVEDHKSSEVISLIKLQKNREKSSQPEIPKFLCPKGENKEVLLIYPGKFSKTIKSEIPLQLLILAAILQHHGFRSKILDMRVEDYKNIDLNQTLCIGISSMTGMMISKGLDFAKYARSQNPSIPLIWGGVHPSLLPEETVSDPLVDIVVRGEGELTLLEIVYNLTIGHPIDNIQGITYKKRNQIINNPSRDFFDLDSIPIELPYDLIDINLYDVSSFPLHTGRGCPHRCAFCYNLSYHAMSYRYKSPKRILQTRN